MPAYYSKGKVITNKTKNSRSKVILSVLMRIAIFGDSYGIPIALKYFNPSNLVCLVGAENRNNDHRQLMMLEKKIKLPFLIQYKKNNKDYNKFISELKRLYIDLIIINSYSMILHKEILELSNHGAVNIHGSLLPRNRGANPIQWALIKGDRTIGVTLHEVTGLLDEGPIIDQIEIPVNFEDSWLSLRDKSTRAIEQIIEKNVKNLENKSWKSVKQNHQEANLNPRRRPDDSEFTWNESIISIYNKVRALLPPMPAAFAMRTDGTKEEFNQIISPMSLTTLKFLRLNDGGYMNGNKVRLRPIRIEDSPLLFDWINSRDVVILNSGFKPTSEFEHNEWMESILTQCDDLVIFAIEELSAGETIGTCKLININWKHKSAELQIRIGDKKYWGKGYGTESIELLCDFGYKDFNLNRIFLHVWEGNKRAIAAYKKVGFEVEGKMREAAFIEGKYENVVLMSILRG